MTVIDVINLLVAAGVGFLAATLLWWLLLFWGVETLIKRTIHRRYFEYHGVRYYIRPDV